MHEGHRQRLLKKAIEGLSVLEEHEVLEALLFYSIPRRDTNDIASNLLRLCGGKIRDVLSAPVELLTSVKGVGKSTAAYLKLLGKVLDEYSNVKSEPVFIANVKDAKELAQKTFKGFVNETFYAFFLDKTKKVFTSFALTNDIKFNVQIDISELNQAVVLYKPDSVLIAHNHLSGSPEPSIQDDITTEAIYTMLRLNKTPLIDHVIVTQKDVYSYRDTGKLDKYDNAFSRGFR